MSGFFGMLRLDGEPVDERLLEEIAGEMSFRGLDGVNVWNQGPVGGCFSLMRTGPAKQAPRQPVGWDNRFLLWGDLRLDARQELLEKLAPETPIVFSDVTSEELLLRSWTKWGSTSLEGIIGDFSFALWDAQQQIFWCARDFVGARPFYYAHVRGVFCFSNTLQVLQLVPEVSGELDELFVGDYLIEGWNVEQSRTVYRDIRRLPAGHLLTLSQNQAHIRRFRKLPVDEPLLRKSPYEFVESYRDLLKQAVRDRLPSGATSFYLSGGLDSASVCVVAAKLAAECGQAESLKAFTISLRPFFDDPEPVFATLTAQHLGLAQEIFEKSSQIPFEGFGTKEGHAPEPNDEMFFASQRRTYQAMAVHSNVVLSGDGGDNVLAGQSWPYLTQLWRRKEWGEIARSFGGYLWSQKAVPPIRGGFRTRLRRLFAPRDPFASYPSWLNPDFESRAKLKQRWLELRKAERTTVEEHSLHPDAYRSLHNGYWATVLETEDAGWSHVPLESRAPLLDLRLLVFLLRLPPVPWCMNKFLCRQSMKDFLPDKIVDRPKTPFVGNLVERCVHPGHLMTALRPTPPKTLEAFVNWSKWCETLELSKGSLNLSVLRPASLFHWLKPVEST